MKKTIIASFLLSALVVCSCGRLTGKKANGEQTGTELSSAATPDSVWIDMDLSSGYAQKVVHKDSAETIWVGFNSAGNEVLYGKIFLPEMSGNVRFNQIFMPDGSADGPFGKDILYDLTQQGDYRLAIGESLMEGEPYNGEVTIELFTGAGVPFEIAKNYFVRNDVPDGDSHSFKITSKDEFDKMFGAAATMSSRPTAIDFSKQYVIAYVGNVTKMATEYSPKTLISKGGIVTLVYNINTNGEQTYTIRPCLLLIVDKQYEGALRVIEANNN